MSVVKPDSKQSRGILYAKVLGYHVESDGTVKSPFSQKAGYVAKTGYVYVTVEFEGGDVKIPIHRLAAYQKFGDLIFNTGNVVRHLDGNPSNNSYDNLALGSQSDNMLDRSEDSRREHAKKGAKVLRKLSDQQVVTLRADRARGLTLNQLCDLYGLSKSTVSYIVNGKTY